MAEEKMKIVLEADVSDLEQGMSDAERAVKEFADEADGAKGKISKFFNDNIKDIEGFQSGIQRAGEISTNFLKVTAGAVAGVGTALVALGPATAEYRGEMAKLNSAFETAGATGEIAKQTYNDLYRVLGDSGQATEAAGHLAQLTTEEKALSEWATICQGVYATFGDSLPIEGLTEAANETAKVGQLTGSLADALNWAGVNEEEFQAKLDACNTEAEREALIRQTLTGLYNEAASSYEKNAAGLLAQNEANAKMTEAMAKLGEAVAPVMTMLSELGAEILADLTPHIESFASEHLPKIQEALSGVGEKIGVVINWIADNWGLVSTIAAVVIGIATAISLVSAGLTAYNTVMAITNVVTLPMIGTIAAIVAGIALLVAGIVLAVKHWDEISVAIKNFASNVGEFLSGLWDKITGWFSDVGDKLTEAVENVKKKFTDIKDNMTKKIEEAKTAVTNKFNEIKTNIGNKIEEAKKIVGEKYEAIKSTMGTVMDAAKRTVQDKLDNIKKAYQDNGGGIKGIAAAAMEGVKGYYTAGYTFIDNLTGGKLTEIKNKFSNILSQVVSTVKEKFDNIKSAITTKFNAAKDTISGIIEKIKGFFNFKITWPKIPMPHFSISPSGWKIGDLLKGEIPRLSIDWYAKGGVFDNPTLFGYNGKIGGLGENGAEAIVPLEKNTYWLDRIADMLSEKMGNGTPIVLEVDGKVFAQTAINSMNNLTRQTGKLNLIMG